MLFSMEVNNPLDQAITALVMAAYQFVMAIMWLLAAIVTATASAAAENVAIVGKLCAIVGVAVFACCNPLFTIGIIIIVAFAYATYPRGK